MRKFVLVGLLALVAGLVFQAPAEARHPVKSFAPLSAYGAVKASAVARKLGLQLR
jgi:hypothetical protein